MRLLWCLPLVLTWTSSWIGLPRVSVAQSLHTNVGIWSEASLWNLENPNWVFKTEDGESVRTKLVGRWGSWMGVRNQPAVCLSDGSWICGEITIAGDGSVSVRNDWLACPDIPGAAVRAVVFDPPVSLGRWLMFQQQLDSLTGSEDTLWLRSGRRLGGIIRWSTPTNSVLSLESNGNELQLAWDEIDALALSPALMGPIPDKSNGLTLGLKDGSLLQLRELPVADQGSLQLTLDAGLQLTSHDRPSEFLASVRYLRQWDPRTEFLSDQTPASYKHLPEGTLSWELGVDRDLYGHALVVGDGTVAKGLAMHSTSQVAYRWDGSAGRFLAQVMFAPPTAGADARLGSATCQVLLGKSGQLQSAGQVGIERSGSRQHNIASFDIDVTDARLIVLVTGAADMGQLGDHVLWLDARVTRPE